MIPFVLYAYGTPDDVSSLLGTLGSLGSGMAGVLLKAIKGGQ